MDINEFMREVYLAATPSVDLNDLKDGEQIDCRNYTIKMSDYERILAEFSAGITDRIMFGNMWMLNSGPRLTE
jgi:hypothetical protein